MYPHDVRGRSPLAQISAVTNNIAIFSAYMNSGSRSRLSSGDDSPFNQPLFNAVASPPSAASLVWDQPDIPPPIITMDLVNDFICSIIFWKHYVILLADIN